MLSKNTIVATICGSTFVSLPTLGQENKIKPDISIAASVHFVGTFGGQQSTCAADSLPGGYRLFFNRCDGSACSPNTPTFNLDRWAIGVKNKSDGGFVAHTFWFSEKRPFVLADAPIFDLRTIAGADTQPRFEHLHNADYFNPTQSNETPQTKHRGVFYNSATFNINGLRGFTDREQPAIVFGYIF
jgi:hypothetical protein